MARGTDWRTAKESKIAQFKTVDRVRVDNPIAPGAYGQGGVDRLPVEPTNATSFGLDDPLNQPPKPSDDTLTITPVEVQDTTLQTNATETILNPDGTRTTTGITMQTDVTKNNYTQQQEGYMPGIEPIASPKDTMQVDYNVPGGGVMTTDVQTWQEDDKYYAQYGDSLLQADTQKGLESRAPVWLQAENQRQAKESGLLEEYTRGGLPQADPGSLFPVTRTDQETGKTYDVFFGGKGKMPTDKQQEGIEDAFVQQDFNKMWTNVKSNIGASLGINSRGYDYYADPSGDGSLIVDERTMEPYANFGQESPATDMSKIFSFYKSKHKGNKKIVDEITAMENRWTIGGTKAEGTSGLFGFNNTGPQSTGKNPMTYYTDMADVNKKQSMKDLNKKNVSQESYDKQVANINKIYDTQKTNKNLYKAYGNKDFYNMGL